MYYNRRTIHKTKIQVNTVHENPFSESGKLKKGYRYIGNGKIKNSKNHVFLISEFK
jgi:hypothetical protein